MSRHSRPLVPIEHTSFRFMDLPVEIRLRILEFTNLVVRPRRKQDCNGLSIDDGKCFVKGAPRVCSTALFYTSRQLSLEAREVCLSVN